MDTNGHGSDRKAESGKLKAERGEPKAASDHVKQEQEASHAKAQSGSLFQSFSKPCRIPAAVQNRAHQHGVPFPQIVDGIGERTPSFQAITELLFGRLPINEAFLTRADSLLSFSQDLLVPGRRLNLLLVPAQIGPKRFHNAQLFCGRHLVKRQCNVHTVSLM
jgi:hypothetical protein